MQGIIALDPATAGASIIDPAGHRILIEGIGGWPDERLLARRDYSDFELRFVVHSGNRPEKLQFGKVDALSVADAKPISLKYLAVLDRVNSALRTRGEYLVGLDVQGLPTFSPVT